MAGRGWGAPPPQHTPCCQTDNLVLQKTRWEAPSCTAWALGKQAEGGSPREAGIQPPPSKLGIFSPVSSGFFQRSPFIHFHGFSVCVGLWAAPLFRRKRKLKEDWSGGWMGRGPGPARWLDRGLDVPSIQGHPRIQPHSQEYTHPTLWPWGWAGEAGSQLDQAGRGSWVQMILLISGGLGVVPPG